LTEFYVSFPYMSDKLASEIIVELNRDGTSLWRARVLPLDLVVQGNSPTEAEPAALAALVEAGVRVSDDLRVRVRYGTRTERESAGWSSVTGSRSGPNR
jgi:hypothetical protein